MMYLDSHREKKASFSDKRFTMRKERKEPLSSLPLSWVRESDDDVHCERIID
jgi:hypothetical protein